jgi:hypothetical protein
VAEDLGCAYTLEVDKAGNSLLRVTMGWVSLQLKDRESVVPAGAACATKPGIGPGTPYFEDASEQFRVALSRVDFERDMGDYLAPLGIVLSSARVRDTLTLWNLLPRVSDADRSLVYNRLAKLVPPPPGVTREGVLKLNQQMLDAWKEQLEFRWSDTSSSGNLKAWEKVRLATLGQYHLRERVDQTLNCRVDPLVPPAYAGGGTDSITTAWQAKNESIARKFSNSSEFNL